jgi:hypothetical protein
MTIYWDVTPCSMVTSGWRLPSDETNDLSISYTVCEKQIATQVVRKFFAPYEALKFITVLTRTHHTAILMLTHCYTL